MLKVDFNIQILHFDEEDRKQKKFTSNNEPRRILFIDLFLNYLNHVFLADRNEFFKGFTMFW